MFDNKKPFATADFGKNMWHVWNDKHADRMTKEQFAKLDWLGQCKQVVAEYAHLQVPRTVNSKSQVYTNEERQELLRNAHRAGVSMFCFPQGMRPTYNPEKKDDIDDAKALAEYLAKYVNIQQHIGIDGQSYSYCWLPRLKHNYDFNTQRWCAIHEFRKESNAILNWARAWPEPYKTEPDQFFSGQWSKGVDAIKKLASDSITQLSQILDGGVAEAYRAIAMADAHTMRYTLAAMVVFPDGTLRINKNTGKPPGINWLMHYQLGFTNLHHRGGVARSNVQYHGLKNYLIARFKGECSSLTDSFRLNAPDDSLSNSDDNLRTPLYEMNLKNRELVRKTRKQYRQAVKLYLKDMRLQVGKKRSLKARQLLACPTRITSPPATSAATQVLLFADD